MRKRLYILCLLLLASPAAAQDPSSDPRGTARIHLGALALNPTMAIRDVGVDTNVFNEWENPKSDFTATVGARTDSWLRVGRGMLSGRGGLDYVFFREYSSERSLNGDAALRFEYPFTHVRPHVGASYLSTRDRQGFEIDLRARRTEGSVTAGVDLPFSSRFTLGIGGRQTRVSYAADAVFAGTSLRQAFDRDVRAVNVTARYKLTPLATLVMLAEGEDARFRFSPIRDSRTIRVTPGLELNPYALIKGTAYIGFRSLDMRASGMPDYKGLVAAVELGYAFRGTTGLTVRAERDVYYSFEIEQPYYVMSGLSGSVIRQVAGPWGVQARLGLQQLDYHGLPAATPRPHRTDRYGFYGGGIVYRVGHAAQIGFIVDSYRRRSPVLGRDYRGMRLYTSVTYGS